MLGVSGGRAAVAGVVASLVVLSGCTASSAAQDPSGTTVTDPAGPAHPLDWGVFLPDDNAPSSALPTVEAMAAAAPENVLRFAAIDQPVPLTELTSITNAGAVPVLTLEPWLPDAGVDQPEYSLARIAAGDHDAALQRWAAGLAAWNQPLLLRFAHEMNSTWYPWAIGVNGNTAADYLAAWRHVHDVFRNAGADQVSFVWAPNVPYADQSVGLADVFPGPEVVDVLGIDGYNWGDGDGHVWQSPAEVLGAGLHQLRALPGDRPILVTETASAEGPRAGTDKAEWINSLVDYLVSADRVTGFIWFQAQKERDWRFNSTEQSQAAFRNALARRPAT